MSYSKLGTIFFSDRMQRTVTISTQASCFGVCVTVLFLGLKKQKQKSSRRRTANYSIIRHHNFVIGEKLLNFEDFHVPYNRHKIPAQINSRRGPRQYGFILFCLIMPVVVLESFQTWIKSVWKFKETMTWRISSHLRFGIDS